MVGLFLLLFLSQSCSNVLLPVSAQLQHLSFPSKVTVEMPHLLDIMGDISCQTMVDMSKQ